MLIRPLQCLRDHRPIADIAIQCWNHNVADKVIEQIAEGYYLVAEIDGHVAGFTGARKSYLVPNAWEIPWIAVSPDHQGKQVGSALLGHLTDELNNLRRASLVLAMTQRIYFFESAGFDVVQFYNDGWALMTMPLRPVGL
jgi:N-acetylglutamate synthase-like GNAT family acetyltransferase